MHKCFIISFLVVFAICAPGISQADILVNGSTQGYYNATLGTSLDFTNPYAGTYLFPGANSNPNDPTFDPVPFEPDLSSAASALGNWLSDPLNLNSNWSGLQSIPSSWTVNSETAIIYMIDAGVGLQNTVAKFGVDNGIFVWLDGAFLSGELRPGGAVLGEHVINIGDLSAGTHFLQILREDHGGGTGYSVEISAEVAPVPEPATMLLIGSGLVGLAGFRKKMIKRS